MPQLVLNVVPLERAVVVQVVHQDESLRGVGMIIEHEGFTIRSYINPAAYENDNDLYVRGRDRDEDYCPAVLGFDSNESRDAWIKRLQGAMDALRSRGEEKPSAGVQMVVVEA